MTEVEQKLVEQIMNKEIAKYLVRIGYKQTSRRHKQVSRVNVTKKELIAFYIEKNFGDASSSLPSLPFHSQEDFYRRSNLSDKLTMPEEVMKEMRILGAVAL